MRRMSGCESTTEACSLCDRQVPPEMITLHHLKPRERGGRAEHRTPLCRPCHKQLHAVYSNKRLARSLDRIELLKLAPELQNFLRWIRKQKPNRNFRTVMSSTHARGKRRRREPIRKRR
jgi:5-methylcytosine-specific restriction protein A